MVYIIYNTYVRTLNLFLVVFLACFFVGVYVQFVDPSSAEATSNPTVVQI
jgi:hypothetical protein